MLLKNWVDDQETYFTRASARQQRKLEGQERGVQRLFVISMGLAVLVFLLQGLVIVSLYPEWITIPIVDLLLFLMSLALVFAALRDGYTTRMAYSEQIKRYQQMGYLFRLASHHLKAALKAGRPQEAEHVIRELGKEALEENGDWVLLHRTRPISVPR
jgi:Flp pilus assembly protein TadB